MKILLLEDDRSLRELISERLRGEGYAVEAFLDGHKAYSSLDRHTYDLLLLDINVPGLDGYTFLQQVRSRGMQTPAIIVTAHGDMDSLDEGYALGCNDFLRKPFGLKELLWRIQSALPDRTGPTGERPPDALMHPYSFCLQKQVLYFGQQLINLTPKERQLVALLIERRGRVVQTEEILEQIWPNKGEKSQLRALIFKLRQKLHSDLIASHKGLGYQID